MRYEENRANALLSCVMLRGSFGIVKHLPAMTMKMRLIITKLFAGALLVLPSAMNAQEVNYKILKNDPKDVNNLWVYLDLAQMDVGFKNIDGCSFSLGAWAVADYNKKLGAEAIMRYGWLTFGKSFGGDEGLHAHHQIEIGGFLQLKESNKIKSTQIILSQSSSTQGGREVTTTKYIMVPANKVKQIGVRAGFMSIGGVLGTDQPGSTMSDLGLPDVVNYGMTGIYAGLLSTSTMNILINTDSNGKRGKFKYNRVYLDAMILPIRSTKLNGVDYKNKIESGPLGFRLGWYAMPAETRKMKAHDVKTRGSAFQVEAGIRPYDGIYITGTWSIPLIRTKSAKLGYTAPVSEQNTSE
jgi:hypothetical protein